MHFYHPGEETGLLFYSPGNEIRRRLQGFPPRSLLLLTDLMEK